MQNSLNLDKAENVYFQVDNLMEKYHKDLKEEKKHVKFSRNIIAVLE